ncbi:MAG TPA: hypothetical protein EYH05_01865 [Anaerolineae bacterium]|nr:hypothetical protein [Anaerolineae bacterium]
MFVDLTRLQEFEEQFDPRRPENGRIPARVLGFGEISAVLSIPDIDDSLAFKRMPMFENEAEVAAYTALYREEMVLLEEEVGLNVAAGELAQVSGRNGRPVLYLIQPKLPVHTIVHKAIHALPAEGERGVFTAVLRQIRQLFAFNQTHQGQLEIGLDAQLSNWAIADWENAAEPLPDPIRLIYFDTNTPLLQKNGVEQLDPELFLRSAPSFLVPIVRHFFLEDVLTRYYNLHLVIVDLIANLYKEQRGDLVPAFIAQANTFLAESGLPHNQPITAKEVQSYYREDAFIWRLYLTLRKTDRTLYRLRGKPYPYVLPEKIQR